MGSHTGRDRARRCTWVMRMRKAEVRADHSELILIRHAKEVEAALAKLPPGALHPTRRETIRVNLSLLTDGKVGGVKLSVQDRGVAKRSALKSIKNLARELPKPGATAAATKDGEAAWQQFVRIRESFSKPEPMPAKPMSVCEAYKERPYSRDLGLLRAPRAATRPPRCR